MAIVIPASDRRDHDGLLLGSSPRWRPQLMRGWTAWPPWRRPIARTPRAQDDDGGEGTNSSFSYTVTADGRYSVRANSYDGSGRGRYDLEIRIARGAP